MNTLNATKALEDEITEMIESGRIPKPEYLGEYSDWRDRFESGHGISQIVEHTEADRRVVVQALYAMDLISKTPTSITPSDEEDMVQDYYTEKMSHGDLAEKYDVHDRKPSWIVRVPALRLMIDGDVEPIEVHAEGNTDFHGGRDITEKVLRKWKRKNGKKSGNYSARVKSAKVV